MPKKLKVNLPYIPKPDSAEAGQVVVVKAVDENGKPTKWETKRYNSKLSEFTNDLYSADNKIPYDCLDLSEAEAILDDINGEVI